MDYHFWFDIIFLFDSIDDSQYVYYVRKTEETYVKFLRDQIYCIIRIYRTLFLHSGWCYVFYKMDIGQESMEWDL